MKTFSPTLAERRVLITGAGHGLGRALAGAFAEAGARIIVTDHDPSGVEATTRWLCGRGDVAIGLTMDVTCQRSIRRARQEVLSRIGAIDILINNAGTVHGGRFCDVSLDRHLMTLQVNTIGPIQVTHAFLPDLITSKSPHLVNILSAAALTSLPGATTYAASKWAMLGFTDSLRAELQRDGHGHVGVTSVCPSFISTGLFTGSRPPRFTRILTPAAVARHIVHAVHSKRQLLVLPRIIRAIPLARALLPRRLTSHLADWLGISSCMSDWQGHGPPVDRPEVSNPALAAPAGNRAPQPPAHQATAETTNPEATRPV